MRDNQHTQNIQINKVIGKNEKCVFYFAEKAKQTFWPTQYKYNSNFRFHCFPEIWLDLCSWDPQISLHTFIKYLLPRLQST